MRPSAPELARDPFFYLVGRRIIARVDGQAIKGRLLSVRDGFCTIDPDRGPRTTVNKWSISSISEEHRPISRSPKITKMFWK
jgi:hypothetical protein